MRKRKHVLPYLLIGFASLCALLFFVFFVDPEKTSPLGSFTFSPIFFFFILLFIFLFSVASFITTNLRMGILTSFFLTSLFFLKIIGFLNVLYAGILLAIIVLVELGFRNK